MNKKIFEYLNSLSQKDVREILSSVSREGRPQAYAFWSRVLSAKGSGWNDDVASRFSSDAEILGDSIIIGSVPKSIFPKRAKTSMTGGMAEYTNFEQFGDAVINEPIDATAPYPGLSNAERRPQRRDSITPDINTPSRAELVSKGPKNASNQPSGPKGSASNRVKQERAVNEPTSGRTEERNPLQKKDLEQLRSLGLESINKSIDEFISMSQSNADSFNSDRLARRESLNYFLNNFSEVLGPLRDTIDFLEQRKFEKQAERIADRSMRQAPSAPTVRGENRILSNLIRNSQVAYSNPQQMIQPYMDQVNLGYQQDLARAQELSGGQAGNMAGMSQAAAIRRNQANLQGAGMSSDIFREGLATTGALVGQQMQDDTWRDQQNIELYRIADNRNQELQRQAGMGLAASRARSIQARNNMLDSILSSPAFDVDTYMNYTRSNLINPPRI